MTDMPNKVHEGRNVKRFREMMGYNQEGLASLLGEEWTQKKISLLESKETIDPAMLEELAKALKVPADAIKNFNEEAAVYNIQNNYEGSNNHGTNTNYQCTINPIDKLFESMEENKKLYERLLAAEREKNALLEKLLTEKK